MIIPAVPRGLRRSAAAVVGAAALVVSAAFSVPADAFTTTTLRGTVTVAGHAVAGVPVGTWSPARGVLATAATDARGRFVLRSPSGVSAVAYAGSTPSSSKAVLAVGPEHLVRGVIGGAAPTGLASPLAQLVSRALPARLGGGRALRFRLQPAGRFTASSPVLGTRLDATGVIEVDRGNGGYPTEYRASAAGAVMSGWLVPGRYHLLWNGDAPLERSAVTVRPGATVTAAAPTFRAPDQGATISIHARSGGAAVPEGVPAIRLTGTGTTRAPSTDATGTIVADGFAAGTYRFTIGELYDDPDEGRDGPPSTDDYLVRTISVTVPAGASAVSAAVDLAPASKVSGAVAPFVTGSSVAIQVEDADGTVVRGTIADQRTGAFVLGGLAPGTYRVVGDDADHHRYDVETVVLPAASSAAAAPTALDRPLDPTIPDPTVHGTVPGAAGGSVFLRTLDVHHASLYTALGSISKSGRYSIRTIPARLKASVQVDGRADRTFASGLVTGSQQRDLVPGARLSTVTVRFTVHGNVVPVDVQADGKGDLGVLLTHASGGFSIAHGVIPGRYTWARTVATLPAADGPWSYTAPTGSFTVRAGTTARLGTEPIAIRG